MSRKSLFEVYTCTYKDMVVYVGHGAKGRHKHCNGGISHVRQLNEIHFFEGCDALNVSVKAYFKDKKDAIELEKYLIDLHRPAFNKIHNSSVNPMVSYGDLREIKKNFYGYSGCDVLTKSGLDKYRSLVDEFLDYVSARDLKEKTVCLYSSSTYIRLGLKEVGRLSRFVRNIGNKGSPTTSNTLVFYDAIKDMYDIDLKNCIHTAEVSCKNKKTESDNGNNRV